MTNERLSRRALAMIVTTIILFGVGCSGSAPAERPSTDGAPPPDGPSATQIIEQSKQKQVTEEPMEEANTGRPPVPTAHPGILPDERIKNKIVRLNSSKGEIVFELYADDAPKTVSNFVALAESGYFDGLTFHRVVPGFVIQGGDPEGTGRGGPGYKFEDETVTRDYMQGTVAMANAGPNTNGSQFFICLEDLPTLPKDYTIFGQVLSGIDVVQAIQIGDIMNTVVIEDKE